MAVFYFDSSALVKRYAFEVGTAWVANLTDPIAGHRILTVRLTGPELMAAFFRKVRTGHLTAADARQLGNSFRVDWQTQYQILEVSPLVADRAMALVEQHPLRGYDAMHLAAAIESQTVLHSLGLPSLTFASADDQQLQAAAAEGLQVDNPNRHQ